jgi:photosystem II PsbY protein
MGVKDVAAGIQSCLGQLRCPSPPWQFAANGKNKGLGCRKVLKISIVLIPCPMDLRLALVALPILLALGWAGFNIGRAALGQLQLMIKRAGG